MRYYDRLREIADRRGFDGCTMATGLRRECCAEHDFHYKVHRRLTGGRITKDEADRLFLHCMQRRGWLGWWSPLAWARYAAVRWFGQRAWDQGGRRG